MSATNETPKLTFGIGPDFSRRFNGSSTALQVLRGHDLTGKVALVTGANSGIGYETARALLYHNCSVILACRNLNAAASVIAKLEKGKSGADCIHLDLASLRSVEEFVQSVKAKYTKLDVVILNAGVLAVRYAKTCDGYEKTFQVNHLSHLHLINLLQPLLKPRSRVIFVSSEFHRLSRIRDASSLSVETLSPEVEKYSHGTAYRNSKLLNVLAARQLAKNLRADGVSVFSLHPGSRVATNLLREWWFYNFIAILSKPFKKSLQQGAATSVYCACAPELEGITGVYFNDCYPCEESECAQSDQLAVASWDLCIQMINAK